VKFDHFCSFRLASQSKSRPSNLSRFRPYTSDFNECRPDRTISLQLIEKVLGHQTEHALNLKNYGPFDQRTIDAYLRYKVSGAFFLSWQKDTFF
jgi:hypothetical protein